LTPTNLSRIEWLSREHPEMVEEVDGRLTVVVSKGEKVGNVMKLVAGLTSEWAEDNDLDPYRRAPQPSLRCLRQPEDPFWEHELGWGL
jgi:hypothetical protein